MNEATKVMALMQELTAEEMRIMYAFLLALKGDAEGLEALEAARAAGDMERVKKVSEEVIERAEDFTK